LNFGRQPARKTFELFSDPKKSRLIHFGNDEARMSK